MDVEDLDPDPIAQFGLWLAEAGKACPQPHAMTLATADANGHFGATSPPAQWVLKKYRDFTSTGF